MYKKILVVLMLSAAPMNYAAEKIPVIELNMMLNMLCKEKKGGGKLDGSCEAVSAKLQEISDDTIVDVRGLDARVTIFLNEKSKAKLCKALQNSENTEFKLAWAQLKEVPGGFKKRVERVLGGQTDEYVSPKKDDKGNEQEAA